MKYLGKRFDLVIGIQDVATAFIDRFRAELFPETPVVFYVNAPPARRLPDATGVVAPFEVASTLELAIALQPDTERVFVVSGSSARDQVNEAAMREQFRRFEPRLGFVYLSNLPARELEQRLAALPAQSIVFYGLFYQDRRGENFNPVDFLDRVTAMANRPVYSWVDTAIGHGVVGGNLRQLEAILTALADRAVQVLRGQSADSFPILTSPLQSPQVDWRQLRRWGISEARVPPGTTILFREPRAWEHTAATCSAPRRCSPGRAC